MGGSLYAAIADGISKRCIEKDDVLFPLSPRQIVAIDSA